MLVKTALAFLAATPSALACLGYTGGLPKHTGTVALTAPIYVKAGQIYDGGWRKFDRNPSSCNGQSEGGKFEYSHPSYQLSHLNGSRSWC